ncbi:MAG: FecR family protein [Sphingobacteriaceae bacterium]|nr:FecR family protein [Sphingobacteriaceae bacterium]
MSQDRFAQLLTKEVLETLTPDEARELAGLKSENGNKEKYDLFISYFSANNPDHSSDDLVYNKVRQKILQQENSTTSGKARNKGALYWKIAVAAMLTIISSTIFLLYQKESVVNQQASTKRAVKKAILLSDGTRVTLNSDSKLLFPEKFSGENREVTLIGEGFFDVVKDTHHPFIIHTRKMEIKVLGTAFNVKSYPNDRFSEATLIRGIIEVTLKDRPSDRITLRPSEKLIVRNIPDESTPKKNEQRVITEAITQVTHLQKSDSVVIETSWMQNKVIFRNQTFAEISKMLERVYDVEISIRNQEVENLKFTGAFEKESVEDVLKTLSLIEPFSYKINKNQIIIN